MVDIRKLSVKVEKTDDGYRLTDHLGNVYDALPMNGGPNYKAKLVKAGRFPGFGAKDVLHERDGTLFLIGR